MATPAPNNINSFSDLTNEYKLALKKEWTGGDSPIAIFKGLYLGNINFSN